MDYRAAIAYISQRSGYDRGFVANPFDGERVGLLRTAWLLNQLGNPQARYPAVHIAGTKGKGSTAACLESILRAAGRPPGLYASPHLHSFRERIQFNGQPVDEATFAAGVARLADLNGRLATERPDWGEATAFEVTTALALLLFAEAGVEIAIVEVGLGGRLDATNVLLPEVAVISSISYDHTRILGETLAEIAAEKGGIIKPGRPVVSAAQPLEAVDVLRRLAGERGSPILCAGCDWRVVAGQAGRFDLEGPWGRYADLHLALRGPHQRENAGLAVAAGWLLRERGIRVDEAAIRAGLASVVWPGRFEVVGEQPIVVIDGAHNVDSAERLAEALRLEFAGRPITLILGVMADKDIEGIVRVLTPIAGRAIATASQAPRAATPDAIAAALQRAGGPDLVTARAPDAAAALELALAHAGPDEVICVTGSLALAAEAREALGLAHSAASERELLMG